MEPLPQPGAETHGINPAMTAPNFGPPVLQAPGTIPFEKAKQKRTLFVVLGMVIFLIIAMAGLGIGLMFWTKDSPARINAPSPPVAGNPPVSNDLIYPGAKVTIDLSEGGKRVLQLRTDDPVEDVVDWYEKKMGSVKKIYTPVGTTMTDGNRAVVITGIGEGTQIILTQK